MVCMTTFFSSFIYYVTIIDFKMPYFRNWFLYLKELMIIYWHSTYQDLWHKDKFYSELLFFFLRVFTITFVSAFERVLNITLYLHFNSSLFWYVSKIFASSASWLLRNVLLDLLQSLGLAEDDRFIKLSVQRVEMLQRLLFCEKVSNSKLNIILFSLQESLLSTVGYDLVSLGSLETKFVISFWLPCWFSMFEEL